MKKLLLLSFLTFLPLMASADPVEINGIYYNIIKKGSVAEVTANPDMYSGDIVIPEKITYEETEYSVSIIGERAFASCRALTSISIPSTITDIKKSAFVMCERLSSVHITDLKSWCNITFFDNPLEYAGHLFVNDEEVHDLIIPEGVITINTKAFMGCVSLNSVTCPNGLSSIGNSSFQGCINLKSITIPKSVTSIGNFAFNGCTGLASIDLPESLTEISEMVFENCTSLTSISIPNSVTSIGDFAFSGCTGLTSIDIPESLTELGGATFKNCTSLTSITIPNGVGRIERALLYGCTSLTSITIPNSVTSIANSAFYECSHLTSVSIGSGVNYISNGAFASCPELTDVYCYVEEVTSDNSPERKGLYTARDAFYNSYPEYITLHVPEGSIDAYKAVEPWSGFKEIVALESTKIHAVTNDSEENSLFYNLNGQRVSKPSKGIYIVNGKKVVIK